MVTYRDKSNRPTPSGVLPSEFLDARSQEDVYEILYKKLKLTKEEFHLIYSIVEILQIDNQ